MESDEQDLFDDDDSIEPCRTCGVYFILHQTSLLPIFTKNIAGSYYDGTISEIVQQMKQWNLQVNQNDGRPQHICIVCIGEFQKILKFKRSCLETKDQFDELDVKRAQNSLLIKKEQTDDQKFCGFVYLDTDDEEDNVEYVSEGISAFFDIPHVPIKEEHAAHVSQINRYRQKKSLVTKLPDEATFAQVKPEELATANGYRPEIFKASPVAREEEDSDEEIIKFTYEDDDDCEIITLPKPIEEPGVCCKLCGYKSITEKLHLEHMERSHMLVSSECNICGKKFTNVLSSRIKLHKKWHKLRTTIKCPVCGFCCKSKASLEEHKVAMHTWSKCDYCSKRIKPLQMGEHLKWHIKESEKELKQKISEDELNQPFTPQELIQCAFCDSTFNDTNHLEEHVKSTHILPLAKHPTKTQLNTETSQLSNKLGEKNSPSTSHAIKNSQNREHSSKLLFTCQLCGKKFDLKIKLNRHLRQHTKAPF